MILLISLTSQNTEQSITLIIVGIIIIPIILYTYHAKMWAIQIIIVYIIMILLCLDWNSSVDLWVMFKEILGL